MKKFDKSAFIGRFKEETNEHLARLEKDILYLENNPNDEKLLEDMMREAHTLKGSATMMGYKRIAEMAHKFEDALSQIKKGRIKPGDAHFELLFKGLDTIRSLLEDKITWEDKGIAYPYVINLAEEIDRLFEVTTEKEVEAKKIPKEEAVKEALPKKMAEAAEVKVSITHIKERMKQIPAFTETAESIRVEVNKLDQLMNLIGELVVEKIRVDKHKTDLDNFLSKVEKFSTELPKIKKMETPLEAVMRVKRELGYIMEEFEGTADELSFVISQLQDRIMAVRMLPLDVIFRMFPRAVRDLSKSEGKTIEFNISGEETELDKTVIEKIQDPLMHILRNAVNHGIEPPRERKKLNKSEIGRIDLRAYYRGSQVIIEVEDDGRGIDAEKAKEAAIKKGILSRMEAKEMSDTQALSLLFTPDLSTVDEASQISGRGVGLDVVKTNVTQLKGMIDISSEVGKGTKFTIKLPLTLAVTPVLIVKVYQESYAVPLDNVEQVLRITAGDIKRVERREAISVGDEIIPLIRLDEVLGLAKTDRERRTPSRERRTTSDEQQYLPAVIVGIAEKKLAILVDELIGRLDVVAKNLGDHLKRVPNIAGATALVTGEIVLILDIPSLVIQASGLPGLVRPSLEREERIETRHTILIVEDSLITRDLEKSILEAAGYKVGLAKDGEEALKKLSEEGFHLVVADVAMPGMDGIELIKKMKKDERLKKIPVIIVSAMRSDEGKKRGLEAGANAYIVKSEFDQTNLLDTIERLIG